MTEKNLGWSAKEYANLAGFASDWRDTWWNQDYLELLAKRLRLSEVHTALDVGCGVGHWGQRLAPLLASDAAVVGVDHEEGFLDSARERAAGRPGRCTYQRAAAEALPFDDDHFDLVTCQTVLIHVADARVALREMVRVLKPGGLLLAAEPNNLPEPLSYRMSTPGVMPQDLAQLFGFEAACWQGKLNLGQGDGCAGERLPAYFAELGVRDLQVVTNDRCATLIPPYEGPDTQLHLDFLRGWVGRGSGMWGDHDTTCRLFLAGGGDEAAFAAHWELSERVQKLMLAALDEGHFYGAGGFLLYVVSGRPQ